MDTWESFKREARETPARPPQEDDHIPTQGQDAAFQGTNPWSGPFLVLGILGGVGLIVLGVAVTVLIRAL